MSHLFKGLLIGLSIAAPVGPIGVLCIQRTLAHGRMSGLATGLGAATADGMYGAIAAFGLAVISNALVGQQFWFRLIGGVFLLYLGVRTLRSKPATTAAPRAHSTLASDYLSTLFLTLTNPMTILSFIAVFAGLGLANTTTDVAPAVLMVGGVVLGSGLWWVILSAGVAAFRDRVSARLHVVNALSGAVIIAFGVFALAGLFRNQ